VLDRERAVGDHAPIVAAVHEAGSAIVMQTLHAGRYGKHDAAVGPSDVPAAINRFTPHPLRADEVERTIEDYVECAILAQSSRGTRTELPCRSGEQALGRPDDYPASSLSWQATMLPSSPDRRSASPAVSPCMVNGSRR
jgi:hypothetical protein